MSRDEYPELTELCEQLFAGHRAAIVANLEDAGVPTHVSALWRDITDAGLHGIAFADDVGGGGGTWDQLAVVFREAGRHLVPSTLLSTVFAAALIDSVGDDAQRADILGPLLAGGDVATVAASLLWADASPDALSTTLERTGSGWLLRGTDSFVANAQVAAVQIVAARDESGALALVVVPAGLTGVRIDPRVTFGGDSQYSVEYDVELPGASRLGGDQDALDAYRAVLDIVTVLQAGEMLGGAEHVLHTTASYVTIRRQFGVPIGSFQAVQHRLADVATQLTAGEAAWWHAVTSMAQERVTRRDASAVNAWLGRGFTEATVWAHQLQGGIGFARENTLYLWSQRARQLESTLGGSRDHLEVVADAIYGGAT